MINTIILIFIDILLITTIPILLITYAVVRKFKFIWTLLGLTWYTFRNPIAVRQAIKITLKTIATEKNPTEKIKDISDNDANQMAKKWGLTNLISIYIFFIDVLKNCTSDQINDIFTNHNKEKEPMISSMFESIKHPITN